MGAYGLVIGRNSRVSGVNITSNGADGIYSLGGAISDVLLRGNGGNGVTTSSVIMTNSRSLFNRGVGVYVSSPSLISESLVYINAGLGLVTVAGTRYSNNVFDGNNGGNANAQISSGSQAGANTCGGAACP